MAGWFAIGHGHQSWLAPGTADTGPARTLDHGSIVIETQYPEAQRPRPLVQFRAPGDALFDLSLRALPGGVLTFVLNIDGNVIHHAFQTAEAGRNDTLRLTYSWDMTARRARIALESSGQPQAEVITKDDPRPVPIPAIAGLITPGEDKYLAPDIHFVAASTDIEPVGPQPGLALSTPIATPHGYRPIGKLKRGDLVRSGDRDLVPVLHVIERTVPALGSFAPLRLRAPYFGLTQDICLAPMQKILLGGSEVEYLFGREAVLIRSDHLRGGPAVMAMKPCRFVTYRQLVLPEQETLDAMGAKVESTYIGRIRRKPERLGASLLAGIDRATLPEHATAEYMVLSAFDAVVLAEHRAA